MAGLLLMEILVVGDVLLLQKTVLHSLLPLRAALHGLHSLNNTVLPRQLDPNSARNDASSAWTCGRSGKCSHHAELRKELKNGAV